MNLGGEGTAPTLKNTRKASAKTERGGEAKNYVCPYCEYKTGSAQHLKYHFRVHTGERPYQCRQCDYSASVKCNLKKHIIAKHTSERPLQLEYSTVLKRERVRKKCTSEERRYKCDLCDYSAIYKSHLKRHVMAKHSNHRPHKCPSCVFSTVNEKSLKNHMVVHSNEKPYSCAICDYSTKRKYNLKQHMVTHAGEKPYKCDMCGYAATQMSHLRSHMATHTGEKGYKCDQCDYATARRSKTSYLKTHMTTHTGEKPYKCDRCGFAAARIHDLKNREMVFKTTKDNSQGPGRKLSCPQADYGGTSEQNTMTFGGKDAMRKATAKRKRRGKAKNHVCPYCEYKTGYATHLKDHLRVHTSERPYQCQQCDYAASVKSHLKRHIIAKHTGERPYRRGQHSEYSTVRQRERVRTKPTGDGKSYKCDQCDYATARTHDLKSHMSKHTGEKPYKCEVCCYVTSRLFDLKKHITKRTGEIPYKCNLCNYATARLSHLKQHMTKQSGEKPYKCDICGYCTAHMSHLKRHISNHTGFEAL
ncbi:zinc finger protein 845-like [Branchiostoma lanceolatum]|uniref:zinc finger protein 845-like n=1 Tax=Branchiostoma lanceolatum TaxID=7740 RepID=UPI003451EBF2